jgi:predicted nucleic-acid-binding protein
MPSEISCLDDHPERRLTPKSPGTVGVTGIVETVWVQNRAYGLTAQEIATAIERLLQVDFYDRKRAGSLHCRGCVKRGDGSFTEAPIAALGAQAGCTRTLTFDQKAGWLPGFEQCNQPDADQRLRRTTFLGLPLPKGYASFAE